MINKETLFVSFTGSHGTGKSTSVFQKAFDLKIQYPNKSLTVICENAKHSPFKINKETSTKSQMWIFCNQLQQELYMYSHYDIIVTDRTIIDAIAYTKVAGLNTLTNSMLEMAKQHINIYNDIFFKTIDNNPYFHEDGVRDGKDLIFRKEIEICLKEIYEDIKNSIPTTFNLKYI